MTLNENENKWITIAESIRGTAHERAGLPNQDCFESKPNLGKNLLLAAFVSDGHGSKNYFRSHLGSKFAVLAASQEAAAFFDGDLSVSDFAMVKQTVGEKLPKLIVSAWDNFVIKNISENGIREEELSDLEEKSIKKIREKELLVYGSTLLGVLISANFIIYLQLGDGDILTISEDGEVSRPFPKDERFIANETISLCTDKAWNEFSVLFKIIDEKPPALIMISSDGYSNSFRLEEDFTKAATDFYELFRDEGEAYVRGNLKEWLTYTSLHGSGDDTTVVLIPRISFFNKYKK